MKADDTNEHEKKEAFYQCKAMSALDLGKGFKTIGDMAFQYCNSLKTINLPASLSTVSPNSCAFCKTLIDFKVDENSTSTLLHQ